MIPEWVSSSIVTFVLVGSVIAAATGAKANPDSSLVEHGRYVALAFSPDRVTNQFAADFRAGQSVYALISEDSNGFALVSTISAKKPDGNNFFKTHVRYSHSSSIRFEYPFTRFYMKESLAPQAETAYRSARRRTNTYVTVRVKMGLAVIEELYIEGIPVKEYLLQHSTP